MKEENSVDLAEWTFPEVDLLAREQFHEQFPSILSNEKKEEVLAQPEPDKNSEENKLLEELSNEKLEIEKTKMDCESKMALLDDMLVKLKNPISIIDEELIDIIHDLIRKITKKLIQAEISADPTLLGKMINELKGAIDSNGGMISIFLSEQDFEKLKVTSNKAVEIATVDNTIQHGDIIVKSNFTEIRAILDERIDQLLRIQYD